MSGEESVSLSELAELGRAGTNGHRGVVVARGNLPKGLPFQVEQVVPGLSIVSTSRSSVAGAADRRAALDGAAVLGAQLIRTAGQALEHLANVVDDDIVDAWSRRAKQTAALTVWRRGRDQVDVLPDPLGGAAVFRHVDGDLELVSSDYRLLIDVLLAAGRAPRKSLMFQVERAVLNNGGLWHASYEGTERLPVLHGLRMTSSGAAPVRYPIADEIMGGNRSYLDVLNHIRQDVVESVEALAQAPADRRILHLTGGFDSRLVLGAVIDAGMTDRFAFFCSGPEGAVDREIADGLSRVYGLERTNWSGLSAHSAPTPSAQALRVANFSTGLTATGPTGMESTNSVIAGGGGYGEVMRTFYSSQLDSRDRGLWTDGAALADQLVGPFDPSQQELMTTGARRAVERKLAETMSPLRAAAGFSDWTGDYYYTEVRNRYHMGQSSLLWSRVGTRLNPLYSVWALAAARLVPLISRKSNVIGFDLMDSFDQDLARYPFDYDRSSPEYRRQRRTHSPRPFPTTGKVGFNNWTNPDPGPRYPRHRDPVVYQQNIETSRRLKMNFWQVDQLQEAQQSLSGLLERVDLAEVGEALDLDYLQHLAHDHLDAKRPIRHVHAVHALLLWYVLGA
jgi:hypothetical protein